MSSLGWCWDRLGSLHFRCEVKRYNCTTLVGLRSGVEWIWLLRGLPASGAQADAAPGRLTAQQTASVAACPGKRELHRALSGGDLSSKCQSPAIAPRRRPNAGYEVTMLVASMDVPLVLCSTAIGCGLVVRTRRSSHPCANALHQREFANVVPRAGGIPSPTQNRYRSMQELHRWITRRSGGGDPRMSFLRSH